MCRLIATLQATTLSSPIRIIDLTRSSWIALQNFPFRYSNKGNHTKKVWRKWEYLLIPTKMCMTTCIILVHASFLLQQLPTAAQQSPHLVCFFNLLISYHTTTQSHTWFHGEVNGKLITCFCRIFPFISVFIAHNTWNRILNWNEVE